MIVSLNWLKQYTDIDMPIDKLATLIGARLVEIEEVIDFGKKYQNVFVVKVVSVEKHPNADSLHICKVDDGGKAKDVDRDSEGLVQVVCGAPNVRKGMSAVWLPPGSTVPASFDDGEPFVLGKRELRGVVSNGMLASPKELALGDSHEGLLEIDDNAKPGKDFAKVYELNDYLLDIENKSLTHRPDTFGVIGFAREIAAIQGKRFHSPSWLKTPKVSVTNINHPAPKVTIDDVELSSRYQGVLLEIDSPNQKSTIQLQSYLARVGMRPINAIVDVTNYYMMLAGQPLHAFDYEKLAALNNGKIDIHVRAGNGKETLKLLDGRTVTLSREDVVIANGKVPVALAGAMGGSETEVDEKTTKVLLESATFNLYNLRATQMRHGIFSEAITRFTKGQPSELTSPVLGQAIQMLKKEAGLKVVSKIADDYPKKYKPQKIKISIDKINDILGSQFTESDITKTLKNVEFDVSKDSDNLTVSPPWWRADIHIDEDIIEEVGRINGYDEITPSLPTRPFEATDKNELEALKQKLRQILARAGANDVLSYSFVHGDLLSATGQKPDNSYAITNAISPKLQYYRQTLTPSLLEIVHPNIKAGTSEFVLYEINKTHNKVHGKNKEGLPGELEMTALVYANKKSTSGSPYFMVRSYLDFIAKQLGLVFEYSTIDKKPNYPVTAPFDHSRSAYITEKQSGVFIGIIGEYRQQVTKNLKLPASVAGCELGTEDILKALQAVSNNYKPLSRYPGTSQDITLQVSSETSFSTVQKAIEAVLKDVEIEWSLTPTGVYQPENGTTKNITFHIQLTNHEKTITRDEANKIIDAVATKVSKKLSAKVI